MATSVVGVTLLQNIPQNQAAVNGQLSGLILIEVTFQLSKLPTEFLGWAYLVYTSGGSGGIFRSALVERKAITTLGCALERRNIIGVSQGGDTFRGYQVFVDWKRAGIDYALRVT